MARLTLPTGGGGATPRWLVLPLILLIALSSFADRYLLAGLASPIKSEFKLSDGFIGLLLGPAFALVYTFAAIPIARVADRTSRIAVLCIGCAAWSSFTLLTAFVESRAGLAIARVGVGIGEAAYQAPAAALIAAYFPAHQRARALALVGTAIYLGQIAGVAGGPAIAQSHGWRKAFELLGAGGIMTAAVAFVIIREPARESRDARTSVPLTQVIGQFHVASSLRNMAIGMALGSLAGVAFGLWGPSLFERAYGLSNAEAGKLFGLAFGLPGLVGVLLFGVVADHLARRGMHWPLRVSALALTSATAITLAITWLPDKASAVALAIPAGLLGAGWSIGIVAGLQFILPDRYRATGTALALLVVSLVGNIMGPWLAGLISDAVDGTTARGLRTGLSIVIPAGFVGAWFMWRAARVIVADQRMLAGQAGGVGEPGRPM